MKSSTAGSSQAACHMHLYTILLRILRASATAFQQTLWLKVSQMHLWGPSSSTSIIKCEQDIAGALPCLMNVDSILLCLPATRLEQ